MLWPRLIEEDIWKKILLTILNSLKEDNNFIEIDNEIILKARGAIEKMIAVGR